MTRLRASVCASGVSLALALAAGCSDGGFEGTALCRDAVADVVYDPNDGVEVRTQGDRVAWADAGDRGVDDEACEHVRTQTGWFVGIRYERVKTRVELRCRFRGQFFVHTHPTDSSESGELASDGSALYLVVRRKQTIVVSASLDDNERGSIAFSKRYCRPR